MSDFLSAMSSLFTFLFTQLGNVASFFTTNLLGQIILGVVIFSLVVSLLLAVVNHLRG